MIAKDCLYEVYRAKKCISSDFQGIYFRILYVKSINYQKARRSQLHAYFKGLTFVLGQSPVKGIFGFHVQCACFQYTEPLCCVTGSGMCRYCLQYGEVFVVVVYLLWWCVIPMSH